MSTKPAPTLPAVRIVPGHLTRRFQTSDHWRGESYLFHERFFTPHNPFKPCTVAQWFPGTFTEEQAKDICARNADLGLTYEAEFYPPEGEEGKWFFLVCHDTDKALAFTLRPDFAEHCATMEKVGNP